MTSWVAVKELELSYLNGRIGYIGLAFRIKLP